MDERDDRDAFGAIPDEQVATVRRVAERQGLSVAEAIAQALDTYVATHTKLDPESPFVRYGERDGKTGSGVADLGRRHDAYVYGDGTGPEDERGDRSE